MFEELELPDDLAFESAEPIDSGETNSVYFCRARFRGALVSGYLKVADRETRSLDNEARVLDRLASTPMPVPSVISQGHGPTPYLFLTHMPGTMLWDSVDPRRPQYDSRNVLSRLRAYGECLGRIHAAEVEWGVGGVEWEAQPRQRIEGLIGEQEHPDSRFRDLAQWLVAHGPARRRLIFVHGDFNTANVLLEGDVVSGVIDWEFAGRGFREYEIAWALRPRIHFLGSVEEREAILAGYRSVGEFDPDQLKWCEVLNELHFAFWNRDSDPVYSEFALSRAERAASD